MAIHAPTVWKPFQCITAVAATGDGCPKAGNSLFSKKKRICVFLAGIYNDVTVKSGLELITNHLL